MRYILSILLSISICAASFAQESPEERNLTFYISLNGIKSKEIADDLEQQLASVDGITDHQITFLEYKLTFNTTNLLLKEHLVMDRIKAILSKNGVEIQKINRKEIN